MCICFFLEIMLSKGGGSLRWRMTFETFVFVDRASPNLCHFLSRDDSVVATLCCLSEVQEDFVVEATSRVDLLSKGGTCMELCLQKSVS